MIRDHSTATDAATQKIEQRAIALTKTLGAAPLSTDRSAVREYLRDLTDAGIHTLFVYPGSKAPADTRTVRARLADDQDAQREAKAAGRADWRRVKSKSGHYLATTDAGVLDGYLDQYVTIFGDDVPINLGVKLGPSNIVVVDCDTADHVQSFLSDTDAPSDLAPTVRSPGVCDERGRWVHKDGGHFWFVVPDDVELPSRSGTWTASGGYTVMWGERYVLVPPSTRKEGAYEGTGDVHVIPEWLLGRLAEHAATTARQSEMAGASDESTSIVEWSQSRPWAEILGPDWSPTERTDTCGCETWTAPGVHASDKSATAHEAGCTVTQHDPDNPPLHFWTTGDRGQFSGWPHNNISKLQAVAVTEFDGNVGEAMAVMDLFDDEPMSLAAEGNKPGRDMPSSSKRRLEITWANTIEPEPVVWLWVDITGRNLAPKSAETDAVDPFVVGDIACVAPGHSWSRPEVETDGRLACGMVSIAAGREGSGKSSFGIWLAAKITRGLLPGEHYGTPKRVFYLATEDSWRHTLVPRLMAAHADLSMIARVEVVEHETSSATLCLPDDVGLLTEQITAHEVALVVVDPLMSTIGGGLDANASKDVRRALEPLAAMADETGAAVVAIAHFNKATGLDALSRITGSGAFKDVARAVMVFADDGDERVFTQPKHSVGRSDLPSLTYRIDQAVVDTPKGKTSTGVFSFTGWADRSVDDVLADSRTIRPRKSPQMKFLIDYISEHRDPDTGEVDLDDVVEAGKAKEYTRKQLISARSRCDDPAIATRSEGFGKDKRTYWSLED
ncbi:AAA family ATPase [Gordonia sp. ABSL11-1]|uniref:AAA family ATPase n=1 Tax=Gordonia sp. ABSL11-1 TaxID=3053924 RepID=UPI002572CF20|nr:AAA family ATPase [Gordonia sp. ABSL11-1]MDL9947770.1 AAA family ATPase [Gordonia sp. ABSL11-1]